MASIIPPDPNPFRTPSAAIGAPTLTGASGDAETTRIAFYRHEAAIKFFGFLNYLGAAFALVALLGLSVAGLLAGSNSTNAGNPVILFGLMALAMLVIGGIYGGMGYGLRNLQPWARWVTIIFGGLSLLVNVVQVIGLAVLAPGQSAGIILLSIPGLAITGYILYMFTSSRGAMVFSPEYKEVIRQTPQIKARLSPQFKIGVILAILVSVAVGIVGGLLGQN